MLSWDSSDSGTFTLLRIFACFRDTTRIRYSATLPNFRTSVFPNLSHPFVFFRYSPRLLFRASALFRYSTFPLLSRFVFRYFGFSAFRLSVTCATSAILLSFVTWGFPLFFRAFSLSVLSYFPRVRTLTLLRAHSFLYIFSLLCTSVLPHIPVTRTLSCFRTFPLLQFSSLHSLMLPHLLVLNFLCSSVTPVFLTPLFNASTLFCYSVFFHYFIISIFRASTLFSYSILLCFCTQYFSSSST